MKALNAFCWNVRGHMPKLIALLCGLCFFDFQASAQAVQSEKVKGPDGNIVEVVPTTYTFNGQVIELSPEKLAWLQGVIAERGLDPERVLTGTVELNTYMETPTATQPLQTPDNQLNVGSEATEPHNTVAPQ